MLAGVPSGAASVACIDPAFVRMSLEVRDETPVTAHPAQLVAVPGLAEAAWTSFSKNRGRTLVSGFLGGTTNPHVLPFPSNIIITTTTTSPSSESCVGSSETVSSLVMKLRIALNA